MQISSIILQAILGLGFLMFGFMKFRSQQMVEGFQHYGYPGWFRILTGIIEVISAILVIAGIWNETLAAWGSLIIIVTMLGAIFTHLRINDSMKQMTMPILLFLIGVAVFLINIDYLI
ncbi:DoxX family protein [Paenibacillus glycanilyticus]|uniref:DoxX family protein n=1 Tax=Paenibacillus glycanilyticus TaxID=126569 RepID=UPI00203EAFBF|nr:DoxX family protein [Paenibacillus glycanilyticus]MCM3629819.1 DoxX family protein [Paenibacillus glycanilyticus]